MVMCRIERWVATPAARLLSGVRVVVDPPYSSSDRVSTALELPSFPGSLVESLAPNSTKTSISTRRCSAGNSVKLFFQAPYRVPVRLASCLHWGAAG